MPYFIRGLNALVNRVVERLWKAGLLENGKRSWLIVDERGHDVDRYDEVIFQLI
jgi:hypothetical protein